MLFAAKAERPGETSSQGLRPSESKPGVDIIHELPGFLSHRHDVTKILKHKRTQTSGTLMTMQSEFRELWVFTQAGGALLPAHFLRGWYCVCACVYVCARAHVCLCVCMGMRICVCVCVSMCVHVCIVCVCMCACARAHTVLMPKLPTLCKFSFIFHICKSTSPKSSSSFFFTLLSVQETKKKKKKMQDEAF